ncbi:non-LTR reverse transcriptase [Striga asiatica]|uniref:Non-LTR reverse transcriptase n=1 Tax=Striga asiatica TaxID=4170 RepID=A0A5A7Q0G2_STRAF|nr:non-LTR reverse transcriptase [Striga asiatica]
MKKFNNPCPKINSLEGPKQQQSSSVTTYQIVHSIRQAVNQSAYGPTDVISLLQQEIRQQGAQNKSIEKPIAKPNVTGNDGQRIETNLIMVESNVDRAVGMDDSDNRLNRPPDLQMSDTFVPETQFSTDMQDEDMGLGNGVSSVDGAQPRGCDNLGTSQNIVNGFSPMELQRGRNMKDLLVDVKPTIVAVVEPPISGLKARRMVRSFKFGKYHVIDRVGFAGGIWLLWDDSVVEVEVLHGEPQWLHAMVKDNKGNVFLLSIVYASPIVEIRQQLWLKLEDLASSAFSLSSANFCSRISPRFLTLHAWSNWNRKYNLCCILY